MFSHIDLKPLFSTLLILSFFGIWKVIEILVWGFKNLRITVL